MSAHDAILPAIAKAMAAVTKVAKSSRNVEQKYDFASVDDFLAMVNPICAENGLMVNMNEVSCADFVRAGKYGDTHWLRIVFELTLLHTSGQSLAPVMRTVEVIRTGAQSFGAAQSYVLKQYLRALFMIATGDKDDADYGEKGDGPVKHAEPSFDATAAAQRILGRVNKATSLDDLRKVWTDEAETVQRIKATAMDEYTALNDAKDARKSVLSAPPVTNADLNGDQIPY